MRGKDRHNVNMNCGASVKLLLNVSLLVQVLFDDFITHVTGTTWTQELVWLLANNLDYDRAAALPLIRRYPYLE